MITVKLMEITSDEERAEEFLRERGILKTYTQCPYCGSSRIGRVRRNMYKCYDCKREWSTRKGSILEKTKISFSKFIIALKLFELEVPVLKASKEPGLSYNTVHKLFTLIRKRIIRIYVERRPFELGNRSR